MSSHPVTIIGLRSVARPGYQGDARDARPARQNGQELAHLMDNLMNYSRMETDSSSAQVEIVKLKEILGGLETMTQRLIRQRPSVRIHMETIETIGRWAKVTADITGLLTNALVTEKGKSNRIRRLECTGSF
jgi:signal transduction histidine kinase